VPVDGYLSLAEAQEQIRLYMLSYHNSVRPYDYNGGVAPKELEN